MADAPAPFTTAQLFASFTPLLDQRIAGTLSDADFAAQSVALFNQWTGTGTTNVQVMAAVLNLTSVDFLSKQQFADWLAGGVATGPNGDGTYPLSDGYGNTRRVASPARLASVMAKGDRGASVLVTQAPPAADFGTYGDVTLDVAHSMVYGPKSDAGWGAGVVYKGDKGDKGDQGDSAYTVWAQQAGNAGKTPSDFLAWIANSQIAAVQAAVDPLVAEAQQAAADAKSYRDTAREISGGDFATLSELAAAVAPLASEADLQALATVVAALGREVSYDALLLGANMASALGLPNGWEDDFSDESGIDVPGSTGIVWAAGKVTNMSGTSVGPRSTTIAEDVSSLPPMTAVNAPAGYSLTTNSNLGGNDEWHLADQQASYDVQLGFSSDAPYTTVVRGVPPGQTVLAYSVSIAGGGVSYEYPVSWSLAGANDPNGPWQGITTEQVAFSQLTSQKKVKVRFSAPQTYAYYQLTAQPTSGNRTNFAGFDLYLGAHTVTPVPAPALLKSLPFVTLKSTPSKAALYVLAKLGAGAAINADLSASIARNGATFAAAPLAPVRDFPATGATLFEATGIDLSGQPAGVAPRYELAMTATAEIDLFAAILRAA